jgi:hypothetical protein
MSSRATVFGGRDRSGTRTQNRCEYQQQREDGEQTPVRDLHTERVGTVIAELLDDGDWDPKRWTALLPAVQATE